MNSAACPIPPLPASGRTGSTVLILPVSTHCPTSSRASRACIPSAGYKPRCWGWWWLGTTPLKTSSRNLFFAFRRRATQWMRNRTRKRLRHAGSPRKPTGNTWMKRTACWTAMWPGRSPRPWKDGPAKLRSPVSVTGTKHHPCHSHSLPCRSRRGDCSAWARKRYWTPPRTCTNAIS